MTSSRLQVLVAAAASGCLVAAEEELLLGVSYGPAPVMSVADASQLRQDDWFCDEAVDMWGRSGRGDLKVIKQLGANMVRLYGNNPSNDHTNFLDEAWAEGLRVAPGMSDWPYYQQVPGRCLDTGFNCFEQVKSLYKMNLMKGFLRANNTYHPALLYMDILNEPDLKMPPTTDVSGPEGPRDMGRTLISAFDGMLDAEREAGVTGQLINFTATFSYAICASCGGGFAGKPALGQMWTLEDAMHNPEKYGYTPKNDISKAYRERFTHSFNTQNPADDLELQFLSAYTAHFHSTPVYIGEYHRVDANQREDLGKILDKAREYTLFKGISFFQYQVAYWKAGTERKFGLFNLSQTVLTEMPYFQQSFDIHCLAGIDTMEDTGSMHAAVTDVYGGSGVPNEELCERRAVSLPISPAGFAEALAKKRPAYVAAYIENVVHHMGGIVPADKLATLTTTLDQYTHGPGGVAMTFAKLAANLGGTYPPAWSRFDTSGARCAASRLAEPRDVGKAIEWACTNLPEGATFSCADIPKFCLQTPYKSADWIFSRFYKALGEHQNPLTMCDFEGAAIYASSELYSGWTGAPECLEGGQYVEPKTEAPVTTMQVSTTQASTTQAWTTQAWTMPASTTPAPTQSGSAGEGAGDDTGNAAGSNSSQNKDIEQTSTTEEQKIFLEKNAAPARPLLSRGAAAAAMLSLGLLQVWLA